MDYDRTLGKYIISAERYDELMKAVAERDELKAIYNALWETDRKTISELKAELERAK